MRRFFQSAWSGYVAAVCAVALALALRSAMDPWLGRGASTVLIYGAIAVAVWAGGFKPGLLAAVLGYLGANWFFVEPKGLIALSDRADTARLAAYCISSFLIIALGGAMHAARKRAEGAAQELEASDERFRAFMDHSPDCVFIKDGAGRYIFMNRAAEKVLELAPGQWRGKTDLELLPEEHGRKIQEHDRQVLASDAPALYDLDLGAGKTQRSFRSTKFPLRDSAGRRYVGSVSTDVTERKRNDEMLRALQEQLQIVTATMPLAVFWTGRDRRYRWVNPVFAGWLKQPAEAIVGRSMDEMLGDRVHEMIRPHIERVLAGEQVQYERIAHLPGLGERWIEMVLTPTYGASKEVDGWVAVGMDVHDRRLAADEMRETERRKDEFLAMLAHELRNPLAPIRNAVAILGRKGTGDPELRWSQEVIERQVEQMTRLIDDLLDIERISRGKLLMRKERVSLERVIDVALETSRPHITAAGHRLSVVMPSERIMVEADAARLAQVFANLLINAAKYTEPRGSIGLEAHVEGGEALIRVEDDGIGFGPAMAGSLFKPFAQLANAHERSVGGLGIGLSLVRGITSLHGGTVEAHSEGPGKGSEFVVRLPLAAPMEDELEALTPAPAVDAPSVSFRVLVADDNKDAADSLQRLLSLYGHEVRVAYDGNAALQLDQEFQPRVAVLDIGMPGANGYDVARRLREGRGSAITLIAMTGWGQEADRRRAIDAGFDYHLTKPVDPGALNDLLAEVASAKR